jgi:hypothetical protein
MLTVALTPTAFSGKDIPPFNTFGLSCTAMKPSAVVPPLQLNWYHHGVQLDSSVSGVNILEEEVSNGTEKSSVLNITSARVFSSGLYTCSVAVSIPESNTVTTNQSATITISG